MNMTVGPSTVSSNGIIGPSNSFLTVKNPLNSGNSKNNKKAYMQHIKSADEVVGERRGDNAAAAHKSDATTTADTFHVTYSIKANENFRPDATAFI
jgi:hypothetical protein